MHAGDTGVFQLPLVGVDETATADDAQQPNNSDIHVFPFKSSHASVVSPRSTTQHLPPEILQTFEHQQPHSDPPKPHQHTQVQTSLQPDPILRLQKLIGFGSGQDQPPTNLIWSCDSQYLIYSSQAVLIALNLATSDQLCFVGHADTISCLALNDDNSLIASGQSGPFSLVRLWHFATRRCLSIFRNHDHSLHLLQFSHCGNFLCGVGKDRQSKTLLVIWDIRQVRTTGTVRLVAKAHTDVSITKCLFVRYDSSRLVTCGRENVRFWRLKDDTLRSCAVNLSPYIQALNAGGGSAQETGGVVVPKVFLEFSDMCSGSAESGTNDNVVYACTRTGQIFEFNIARMEIENVRVLEPIIKKKTGKTESPKTARAITGCCNVENFVRILMIIIVFNDLYTESKQNSNKIKTRTQQKHNKTATKSKFWSNKINILLLFCFDFVAFLF